MNLKEIPHERIEKVIKMKQALNLELWDRQYLIQKPNKSFFVSKLHPSDSGSNSYFFIDEANCIYTWEDLKIFKLPLGSE
jgi:hypothetical protein